MMKHTNFQSKVNEIKALERIELERAVEAHGGSYDWRKGNDVCRPIIAINPDRCEPGPQDVEIFKVEILNGHLKITGLDNKTREPIAFKIEDIVAGHLSFIIDYIPCTEEVSDVSTLSSEKPFKPKVGDKVWLFNRDRRDKNSDRYGEVIRKARKYLYVKTGIHSEERFDIETLEHDNGECSPCYDLFSSQEVCDYHQKAIQSRREISNNLYRLLTDDEACELYGRLLQRKETME